MSGATPPGSTAPQKDPQQPLTLYALCHKALLWLLAIITTATTTQAMRTPLPTGQFLKWCDSTYGPSSNAHPDQLHLNLVFSRNQPQPLQLHTDWVEQWADKTWVQHPPQQQQPQAQPQPQQPLRSMPTPAGLFHDYTLEELTDTNTEGAMQDALGQLAAVFQQPLQDVAASAAQVQGDLAWEAWKVFNGLFSWSQPGPAQHSGVCMPYCKASVARAKYIYLRKTKEYLPVWVGVDEHGKNIMEYAHRLVCLAFHGGPRLGTAQPGPPWDSQLVVNHSVRAHLLDGCSNAAVLHLIWVGCPLSQAGQLAWAWVSLDWG